MDNSIGNNLPRVKIQNQFSIKEMVYMFGPISRIEVAERLGLTLPTITTSVSSMIKKGLFKEVEQEYVTKSLGRRTMLVDINENYKKVMGIEIRGSVRYVVIVDFRGNVIASAKDETPFTEYKAAMESAASLSMSLLENSSMTWDDLCGVGLTVPGIIDKEEGKLVIHPGYKWKDKSIKYDFASITGYKGPISVENNTIARAFAYAMFEKQELGDSDSMAYMFIATGIGCPFLNSIRSHFGSVAGDGEAGHMIVEIDGEQCVCGNRGCLEAYSSERKLLEKAMEVMEASPYLSSIYKKKNTFDVTDLMDAADNGDQEIKKILVKATRYLGLAIANIENFVKPDSMVIEGKLFSKEEYRRILIEIVHKNVYRGTFQELKLLFKESQELSGAIGASAIAIKSNLESFLD